MMKEFKFLRNGGEAIHKLGDITRDRLHAELIVVTREDDNYYYGYFTEGFGLIDVRFKRCDCRNASDEEIKQWLIDRYSINF